MGSPLTPVLSNIYMEYFEKYLLPSIVNFDIILFRYVDDVFAFIPNNVNLDVFLNSLNNLSPSIKFTALREANNCLPFLDVQVMRGNNNRLCFKLYRKPTHSNLYIPAFSSHSTNIKEGAILNNIFQRVYKVCDLQYMDEGIDFINTTFINLGYSKKFVQRTHFKARQSYYKSVFKEKIKYENTLVIPPECEKGNISRFVPEDVKRGLDYQFRPWM